MANIEKIENILEQKFTKERVAKWRKQFAPRKLNIIVVDDKIAVLRPVTADAVARYSMLVADKSEGLASAARYLINELWLDGDNEIQDDEEYFIAAMLQVQNSIELKKSTFYSL